MKKTATIYLFIFLFISQLLYSQSVSLVKDLNTKPISFSFINSTGTQWQLSNSLIYFNGTDNKGQTLWRTDGTGAGTYSVSLERIFVYSIPFGDHSILFTNAGDFNNGYELWISDGTETGTHLLKDIWKGRESSYPGNFINVDGTVFFKAFTPATGNELYKTDGTTQGTVLVKDLEPGEVGSNPIYKFDSDGMDAGSLNGKLIFSASTSQTGRELFISDGTSTGTLLLKDLYIGAESDPHDFVNLNGALYFLSDKLDSVFLWKTDGTTSGTVQVAYLPSDRLKVCNGKIFCPATESVHGSELWISDGTTTGTHLLMDINPGSASSIAYFTEFYPIEETGQVYFNADDGQHGREPWVTDGTVSGTKLLKNIIPGSVGSSAGYFNFLDGNVIFTQFNPTALWKTNGTTAGTELITDDFIGNGGISETALLNNKLYLNNASAIYQTDGTAAGTIPLDVENNETLSSNPIKMMKLNSTQYLISSSDTSSSHESLYVTDGTESGTMLLKDQVASQQSIYTFSTNINGLAFFKIDFGLPKELWVSDGTITGTKKIASINPQFQYPYKDFAVLNNVLYFRNYTGTEYQLWRSDGTEAGTYAVKDLAPAMDDGVDFLKVFNGYLYFQAQAGASSGKELFRSDGTSAGTSLFVEINPGSSGSSPEDFTEFQGKLFFTATTAANGNELFVTDGTVSGTQLFDDILPGSISSSPYQLTPVDNQLFFTIIDDEAQLWKSDGTIGGTSKVKDLVPDGFSYGINDLTASGGLLYFKINSGNPKLYKSDGTAEGTVVLHSFPASFIPSQFSDVNGVLYFWLNDFEDVDNIWRTNGTECHTEQLDLSEGVNDHADIVLVDGNTIFFALNSLQYGKEPFRLITVPFSSVEICNGIDDDCNGIIDDNALNATITPSGTFNACDGEQVILNAAPTGNDLSYEWYYNGDLINGATTSSLSSSTLGGSVQVVVSSSFGCIDTSDATTVNRISLPKAKITALGDLDICLTGSVILKANNGNGYTYQWLLNNNEIAGATNKKYTATDAGNYKVIVTNADDCSKKSKKTEVTTSCKNEYQLVKNETEWQIYPNPVSDLLWVKTESVNSYTVKIMNVVGEWLISKSSSSSEISIDVSSLVPGIYFLQLESTTGISVKTFEKQY